MHRVTDRVKRFYAKTKKPARLNMSLEPVSGLRTVHLARIADHQSACSQGQSGCYRHLERSEGSLNQRSAAAMRRTRNASGESRTRRVHFFFLLKTDD